MPLYMSIPGIEGDVREAHHQDWIAIDSCSVKVGVEDVKNLAFTDDRIEPKPKLDLVEVEKESDSTTTDFLNWMVAGDELDTVTVENCREDGQCLMRYVFKNVVIKDYSLEVGGEETQEVSVKFKLKYDVLELHQIPYDKRNKRWAPAMVARCARASEDPAKGDKTESDPSN